MILRLTHTLRERVMRLPARRGRGAARQAPLRRRARRGAPRTHPEGGRLWWVAPGILLCSWDRYALQDCPVDRGTFEAAAHRLQEVGRWMPGATDATPNGDVVATEAYALPAWEAWRLLLALFPEPQNRPIWTPIPAPSHARRRP